MGRHDNPVVVGQWHLDQRISVGDDYETCQRWAEALFGAGFNGIYYAPRHDVEPDWPASVALFGDPGYQPTQLQVLYDVAIPVSVLDQGRMQFGIEVLPATPLWDSQGGERS